MRIYSKRIERNKAGQLTPIELTRWYECLDLLELKRERASLLAQGIVSLKPRMRYRRNVV
jgi:hypothetical protein